MAARVSHVSLLLLAVILFTKWSTPAAGEFSEKRVKTENCDVNSEDKDNKNEAVKTRGLPLEGLVSNVQGTITGSENSITDLAKNDPDGKQDLTEAVINAGPGGTRNSFNNRGKGRQSFRGAVFNSGSTIGDAGKGKQFKQLIGGMKQRLAQQAQDREKWIKERKEEVEERVNREASVNEAFRKRRAEDKMRRKRETNKERRTKRVPTKRSPSSGNLKL